MSRFAAMPPAPSFGVPDWETRMLDAMRQNVELLVNQRRESDQASVAVLESTYKGSFALRPTVLTKYTPQNLHSFSTATLAVYGGGEATCLLWDSGSFNNTLIYNTVPLTVLDDIGTDIIALRTTLNDLLSRLRS